MIVRLSRVRRPPRAVWRASLTAVWCGLLLAGFTTTTGAGAAPLENGVSSSSGSWVVLPMGQLSDRSNTFWQLLHASPGSSHWSVVTPPGVADNGGLVGGVAQGSILLGFLPSGRLHFSPLSQSSDGGGSWDAAFLPGALAPVPDALAATASDNGRALAIVGPRTALQTGVARRQWSRLVSTTQLRRASPRCGASALNAVAFSPAGLPVVAAGCSGRGVVGIFTRRAGSWRLSGTVLHGALARANTSVLRLVSSGSSTTALVQATVINQRSLVALWQTASGWSDSAPLVLPRGERVAATSVGVDGTLGVLARTNHGLAAEDIGPGGSWDHLPAPPAGTVALAPVAPIGSSSIGTAAMDAFTASGTMLSVYALTPSATSWAPMQTIRVPLAYGSSG